jgi:hypothetical protein
MAYILNSKGEILEGSPLTATEAALIPAVQTLLETTSRDFLRAESAKKMAVALFERYEMRERPQPEAEVLPVPDQLMAAGSLHAPSFAPWVPAPGYVPLTPGYVETPDGYVLGEDAVEAIPERSF